jgi:hypothetical protein
MRLLVATDAWRPQINGVVRSLEYMAAEAPRFDAEVAFLTPERFRSIPMPTYGEIRLSLATPGRRPGIRRRRASHVHIATEGPIGFAARRVCSAKAARFTTSYHSRFPNTSPPAAPGPQRWSYAVLRRFHNAGCGLRSRRLRWSGRLSDRGFERIMRGTRGVTRSCSGPVGHPERAPPRVPVRRPGRGGEEHRSLPPP